MSIEVKGVERVRIYEQSTFGEDSSGSIGSAYDLRVLTAEATLTQEMLRDEHLVQRMFVENKDVLGRKTCELNLQCQLSGLGTAATGTPTENSLGKVLGVLMGGTELVDGTTVNDVTPSATALNLTAAPATSEQGAYLGFVVDGKVEARRVSNVTGSTVTFPLALSNAPADSSVVYGSATYYLTADPSASVALAAFLESNERDDIWQLMGLFGTFTIDLPLHQLPGITFQLRGADWLHDDDWGTALGSGSLLGAATYDEATPAAFVQSEVLVQDHGTTTRNEVHVSQIQVQPAWTIEPVTSPGGINGIVRWRLRRSSPAVTGSFTTYFEDEGYWEKRANRTDQQMQIQVNNVAGETTVIAIPRMQITDVQRADSEGLIGQTVSWKALEASDVSGSTTDLALSPIVIAQL